MIYSHKITPQNTANIGKNIITDKGLRLTVAANIKGHDVFTRDWSAPDWKVRELGYLQMEKEKVAAGIMNIRANKKAIAEGQGVLDFDLNEKGGDVFLIGSGGSLKRAMAASRLLSLYGVTIGTNRTLKAFIGNESALDYAFFVDAQSDIFTREEWWGKYNFTKTKGIFSFHSHPSVSGEEFAKKYWFGLCAGNLAEFAEETKKAGIMAEEYGELDSGFASIYSQLHLCFKHRVKRVFLLGHDFAYTDYLAHFDRKFKITAQTFRDEDFAFDVLSDINGDAILTQRYLTRTAQLVAFACKNLVDAGIEVYNLSEGGILRADWIKRMTASDYLEGKQ